MPSERFDVMADGAELAAERWEGDGTPVVMLHAGVTDRRSWEGVGLLLDQPVVAYDRRGFGDTPAATTDFTHLDDLAAVLRATGDEPAWLVGNSMGGALAIDAALTMPERVAGLVLISPAVSGRAQPRLDEVDDDTADIVRRLLAAQESGDVEEQLRLHAHLWLDGPAGPEGRAAGTARNQLRAMNEVIVRGGQSPDAGDAGIDAWSRLGEIACPTTVLWGELDVPSSIETYRALAGRIPGARQHELPGRAHLPALEDPVAVTLGIREAMA